MAYDFFFLMIIIYFVLNLGTLLVFGVNSHQQPRQIFVNFVKKIVQRLGRLQQELTFSIQIL